MSDVTCSRASSTANCDAASANWMKTSIFLTSFLSTNCSGSKCCTSPAIRAEYCDASKRVIGPMPLLPASMASQFACVPMPSGDTSPTPVTTTRLLNQPPELLLLAVGLDVLDGLLDARDLLGVLVRDLDPELFLERHHELDGVKRVGSQVIHERRIRRHFLFVDSQLLDDDALPLVCYGHSSSYMYMPPLTASTCPVIYAASSDARKHTAAAMSSGVPSRLSGILAAHSSCAVPVIARVMSVSISPGATTLTVMLRDATSCATDLANPISPAFDAA